MIVGHLFNISNNDPITINCSDDEVDMEYKELKDIITKWINKDIVFFSYPNGDYDMRDLLILEKYGYKLAFTTRPDTIKHR